MTKVLSFNLDAMQKVLLQRVAASLDVDVVEVAPEYYNTKLIDIIDGKPVGGFAGRIPLFADEMLVFKDIDDEKLYEFLRLIRETGMRHIPLKATLTDFNREWTPVALSVELKRENEEMAKYMKK